jgi:hypothetical protein
MGGYSSRAHLFFSHPEQVESVEPCAKKNAAIVAIGTE